MARKSKEERRKARKRAKERAANQRNEAKRLRSKKRSTEKELAKIEAELAGWDSEKRRAFAELVTAEEELKGLISEDPTLVEQSLRHCADTLLDENAPEEQKDKCFKAISTLKEISEATDRAQGMSESRLEIRKLFHGMAIRDNLYRQIAEEIHAGGSEIEVYTSLLAANIIVDERPEHTVGLDNRMFFADVVLAGAKILHDNPDATNEEIEASLGVVAALAGLDDPQKRDVLAGAKELLAKKDSEKYINSNFAKFFGSHAEHAETIEAAAEVLRQKGEEELRRQSIKAAKQAGVTTKDIKEYVEYMTAKATDKLDEEMYELTGHAVHQKIVRDFAKRIDAGEDSSVLKDALYDIAGELNQDKLAGAQAMTHEAKKGFAEQMIRQAAYRSLADSAIASFAPAEAEEMTQMTAKTLQLTVGGEEGARKFLYESLSAVPEDIPEVAQKMIADHFIEKAKAPLAPDEEIDLSGKTTPEFHRNEEGELVRGPKPKPEEEDEPPAILRQTKEQKKEERRKKPRTQEETKRESYEWTLGGYLAALNGFAKARKGMNDDERRTWARGLNAFRDARIFDIPNHVYQDLFYTCWRYVLQACGGAPPDEDREPAPEERDKFWRLANQVRAEMPMPAKMPFKSMYLGYGPGLSMDSPEKMGVFTCDIDTPYYPKLMGQLITVDGYVFDVVGHENDATIGFARTAKNGWGDPQGGQAGPFPTPWMLLALVDLINDHNTFIIEKQRSKKWNQEWRKNTGSWRHKKKVPEPYYCIKLKRSLVHEDTEKKLRAATPVIRQSPDHRWDTRGHERVRVQRGKLPLEDKTRRRLEKRGYRIYTYNTMSAEDTTRLMKRPSIPPKKPDEWIAIRATWVDSYVNGPADAPYVPGLRLMPEPGRKREEFSDGKGREDGR
jgi:hypothetical protein